MASQNPSAATRETPRLRSGTARSGVIHVNTWHTRRFTVVGNHLLQHPGLSAMAIGLAAHIQSLPEGAPVGVKVLAGRFPEGEIRIAAALRELERHGYLERRRERLASGRVVTRTYFHNKPGPRPRTRARAARPGAGPRPVSRTTARSAAPMTRRPTARCPAPRCPTVRCSWAWCPVLRRPMPRCSVPRCPTARCSWGRCLVRRSPMSRHPSARCRVRRCWTTSLHVPRR